MRNFSIISMPKKFNSYKTWILLLVVVIGAIITWLTPWFLDDYAYMNRYNENFFSYERIGSFSELCSSFYWHYIIQNGRLGNYLIVLIEFFPKWVFDILNGCVFALYLWILTKLFGEKNKEQSLWVALPLAWFLIPHISETCFWEAGSFNYLWPTTAALLFYDRFYANGEQSGKLWLCGAVSFLVGTVSETCAIGLLFPMFVWACTKRFHLSKYYWVMGICLGLGTAFEVLCPGIIGRAAVGETFSLSSFLVKMVSFLVNAKSTLLLIAILIIGFIVRRNETLKFVISNNFLLLSIFINVLFFIAIKFQGCGRGIFFMESCSIILLGRMLMSEYNRIIKWACVGALAYIVCVMPCEMQQSWLCHEYDKAIWQRIEQSSDGVIENPSNTYSGQLTTGKFVFYNAQPSGLDYTLRQRKENSSLHAVLLPSAIYKGIYLGEQDSRLTILKDSFYTFDNKFFVYPSSMSPISLEFHTKISVLDRPLNAYLKNGNTIRFKDKKGEKWELLYFVNAGNSVIDSYVADVSLQ